MIDENQKIKNFTETTTKEATIWDWLGRILPLLALCIIAVLHYFKLYEIRDLFLNLIVIIFFLICFVWWYWAIKKIVLAVKYLQNSQEKFLDVARELKKLRNDKDNLDSNRQRGK